MTCKAKENVSSDKLSNESGFSPKNHALSAWPKNRQLVWPINVGHLSDVWFHIEKKATFFVHEQWISQTLKSLKSPSLTIQFPLRWTFIRAQKFFGYFCITLLCFKLFNPLPCLHYPILSKIGQFLKTENCLQTFDSNCFHSSGLFHTCSFFTVEPLPIFDQTKYNVNFRRSLGRL